MVYGSRLLPVLALLALLGLGTPRPAAADDAWRARLEGELTKVEAGLAALDAKPKSEGELVARVKHAHERLCALEQAETLKEGKIAGASDLGTLTQDIVGLKSRLGAIHAKRAGPPPKPQPAPAVPEAPAAPLNPVAPQDPAAPGGPLAPGAPAAPPPAKATPPPAWPESLEWKATGSLVYTETGQWGLVEVEEDVFLRQFHQTGYEGTLSFSVRAGGLKRQIRSATLRVAASLGTPWTTQTGLHEVYEVEWTAQSAFYNDALKTWKNHGQLRVEVTPRYIPRTTKTTESPRVKAHVLKVVTKDGETIHFTAPKIDRR